MPWNDDLDEASPAFLLASSNAPSIRALAGPGSGKGFAIKRRIARLLENGADPEKILAITFTRTSAQDLKTEIASIAIEGAERVHARTVHSWLPIDDDSNINVSFVKYFSIRLHMSNIVYFYFDVYCICYRIILSSNI